MEAETLALAQEIDFSFWGLFARATLIVKLVMIMLMIIIMVVVVMMMLGTPSSALFMSIDSVVPSDEDEEKNST